MSAGATDAIPWDQEAALYVEQRFYTRGTLAELGFLLGDFTADKLKWAYITGSDLPLLYEGQKGHMMGQPGVNLLRMRYLEERPKH